MKIQGHLRDQPLPELFELLANRCESGCLRIGFEPEPVLLYFNQGQLVDARSSFLQGFAVISLAFSRPKAPFEFDDEVIPPESTFKDQNGKLLLNSILKVQRTSAEFQNGKTISELKSISSEEVSHLPDSAAPETKTTRHSADNNSIPILRQAFSYLPRQRLIRATAAILVIAVPAAVGITLRLNQRTAATPVTTAITQPPAPNEDSTKSPVVADRSVAEQKVHENHLPAASVATTSVVVPQASSSPQIKTATSEIKESVPDAPKTEEKSAFKPDPNQPVSSDQQAENKPEATSRTIVVVVQIEQGRVTEAWVKDARPGLEAFEATAIRLARQRHYPKDLTRTETVAVDVTVNR